LEYTRGSVDEARAIVQAEFENIVINPTRPTKLEAIKVDLDFKVEGPKPYTHVDIKQPVGSDILTKQGQLPDIERMGYDIGGNLAEQKIRFVGKEGGPLNAENVLHIIDLVYVPSYEKTVVKEQILAGALDFGVSRGIKFINDL
jgi:hypothetical protein